MSGVGVACVAVGCIALGLLVGFTIGAWGRCRESYEQGFADGRENKWSF